MAGVNKVILVGNLGRDPEIRYSQSGMAICTFSLATTEKYKDEERTEWHRVKAFGRLAEICGEYLSKGRQVYIEGRIRYDQWEDKEGVKHYATDIIANFMQMLGSPGGERREQPRRGAPSGGQRRPSPPAGPEGGYDDYGDVYQGPPSDDEIPF